MPITYNGIKHRLQPPLDCAEIKDLRGQSFHNRLIINYEDTDFTGCVLYHCYPSGIPNALEYNPANSEDDVSLASVNLRDANLEFANLSGADLGGADLFDADLEGTNLEGAYLGDADLRSTNLYGADLEGTNLEGANLVGADLRDANLRGADLEGADLRGARYDEETVFPDTITQEQLDSMTFFEDGED